VRPQGRSSAGPTEGAWLEMPGETKEIFISYCAADRARLNPLIEGIKACGLEFWLDQIEIGWGDKIYEKVQSGLLTSRYVLVYLTENAIKSNWVREELNSSLQREIEQGRVVVLPILDCDANYAFNAIPALRRKKYLSAATSTRDICTSIATIVRGQPTTDVIFNHPAHYSGPIWIKMTSVPSNHNRKHTLRIRWGVWYREITLILSSLEPVALIHSKGDDGDSIPMIVHVDPPCHISFGQGRPTAPNVIDINPFWVDAKSRLKILLARIILWPRTGQQSKF
jgi:hypothetical protein